MIEGHDMITVADLLNVLSTARKDAEILISHKDDIESCRDVLVYDGIHGQVVNILGESDPEPEYPKPRVSSEYVRKLVEEVMPGYYSGGNRGA